MRKRAVIFGLILFGMLGEAVTTAAESRPAAEEAQTIGRTPPRLSFLEGQVSFWRPGAEDWAQASLSEPPAGPVSSATSASAVMLSVSAFSMSALALRSSP